jgi:hypothetical protein
MIPQKNPGNKYWRKIICNLHSVSILHREADWFRRGWLKLSIYSQRTQISTGAENDTTNCQSASLCRMETE